MRYFTLLFVMMILGIGSCTDPVEDEIPGNELIGDYRYSATAIYFDEFGVELNKKSGSGSFNFSTEINIYPIQGWTYAIKYSDFQEHILSTGEKVSTFTIISQEVKINNSSFLIIGLSAYKVKDPDGSVIGQFDGWVDTDGEIYFSCKSLSVANRTKTETTYSALKR